MPKKKISHNPAIGPPPHREADPSKSGMFVSRRARTLSMGHWSDKLMASTDNASAYLEVICRRYEQLGIALTSKLDWSLAEWSIVVLALKDGAGLMEFDSWRHVMGWAHAYKDHARAVYGMDPLEIGRKMRDLGEAHCIMVCEIVDRYWRNADPHAGHGERLEALGLATHKEVKEWNAGQKRREKLLEEARRKSEDEVDE